ncbi:MAG: hypothetical protein BWY85_00440 [Firmicutes bacterium ADurb.Bin506]|nr:MAG: hypothetical protein BWY85_00440 [Firmicutes bacterium ADurb.Bin506]
MPHPHQDDRRAEWSLIRRSALLGDVVDEDTFAVMAGVRRKQLRNKRTSTGEWFGVEIPAPIARPENSKPLFLKSEAETFVRAFKAARKARG